jgi:Arc/MetJ-type ribon-helix-helix transcriptional regulator
MRTISVRLDDASEARLDQLCHALGLTQTEVVKAGLDLLQRQSLTPAQLADRLDLVGCYASEPAGEVSSSGRDHSARLRQKLSQQRKEQQSAAS